MRSTLILSLLSTGCDKGGDSSGEACESTTWFADADGDGFGSDSDTLDGCDPGAGYAETGGDCDDTNEAVAPGLDEVCDGIDNNCDTFADEGIGQTFYLDSDGDGQGDPGSSVEDCEPPADHVANDTDCDDADATVFEGAPELCDGIDNDCDKAVDIADPDVVDAEDWYVDVDGDGYGDPGTEVTACDQPSGYVADGSDCDDAHAEANPGAVEICYDGFDNNCDKVDGEGCVSCGDLELLAWGDWGGTYPIEDAATELGANLTLYSKDDSGFAKDAGAGWADVVIVDSALDYVSATVSGAVEDAVAGGSLLLFDYWAFGFDKTLPDTLGVSSSDTFYTPKSMYGVDGSPVWFGMETLPEPMTGTDVYNADGQINTGLDTKTSQVLATFDDDASTPAIVSTFDGQVIVNGYSPINFQNDIDKDGLSEAAELYANELVWIANCAP